MIWTLYSDQHKRIATFDTEADFDRWDAVVYEVAAKMVELPGSYAIPGRSILQPVPKGRNANLPS